MISSFVNLQLSVVKLQPPPPADFLTHAAVESTGVFVYRPARVCRRFWSSRCYPRTAAAHAPTILRPATDIKSLSSIFDQTIHQLL